MTFIEFLKKKKIDPVQFESAEPALFSEFDTHFAQMGEKSFDHSKKFWFNKLRRAHHLKEEPKPVAPRPNAITNPVAEQAEPLLSPTVEATPYTPRIIPAAEAAPEGGTPGSAPKPGFTPPFRAGATKPSETPADTSAPTANEEKSAPAPRFKPRFRAGVTSDTENSMAAETEPAPADSNAPVKNPGFAPRFKPGQTKPAAAPAEPVNIGSAVEEMKPAIEPAENPEPNSATPTPKPGFKPRFRAGVTAAKPVTEEGPVVEQKTEAEITPAADDPAPAKMGFTPRFKAGVTTETAEEPLPAPAAPTESTEASTPDTTEDPKPAYKPRFKPSMAKPKKED